MEKEDAQRENSVDLPYAEVGRYEAVLSDIGVDVWYRDDDRSVMVTFSTSEALKLAQLIADHREVLQAAIDKRGEDFGVSADSPVRVNDRPGQARPIPTNWRHESNITPSDGRIDE